MTANLEWINYRWNDWLTSNVGQKVIGTGRVKEHPEHIAKLFAAYCLDRLRGENEVEEEITGA